MRRTELEAVFDQQAPVYDERWARMAPIRESLHLLLQAVFAGLPEQARLLCVGAGTGEEIDALARRFPRWTFVAVDPSAAMVAACRRKAERGGFEQRCQFHHGYLESLPEGDPFDAATCFLVSQFILDQDARVGLFRAIAERLRPGGILASSDLAADVESPAYDALLPVWLRTMSAAGVAAPAIEQARAAYARDVAILPPPRVATLIRSGGFTDPVLFHQAGLIHAWFAGRAAGAAAAD